MEIELKGRSGDIDRDVYCVLGLPFDAMRTKDAVRSVQVAAVNRARCFISTPNLNFLIACQQDELFRDTVIHSDMSVADGMPIFWVAKLLGIPLPERVSGSGLFESLSEAKDSLINIYFFGGHEGVAEMACHEVNRSSSGLHCVGFNSPGFGSIDDMSTDEIIGNINASGADFLVVALGAKKGNDWIEHNLPRLKVPVVSHLGAVVNFAAGSLDRAPRWVQVIGFEWLWRIKEEPRLWRRYLLDGLAFTSLIVARVLPYAWFLKRRRTIPDTPAQNAVAVELQLDVFKISLHGSWTRGDLDPLRSAIREAKNAQVHIQLDLGKVHYVDSAFIGLIMLLFGHQRRVGKGLNIVKAAKPLRRIFKWNCAEYLLEN